MHYYLIIFCFILFNFLFVVILNIVMHFMPNTKHFELPLAKINCGSIFIPTLCAGNSAGALLGPYYFC